MSNAETNVNNVGALPRAVERPIQFEPEPAINVWWAKVVSNVISPPVMWGVMALFIARRDAPSMNVALVWAVIYAILVGGVPLLYIFLQVRLGNIADMHMPNRSERIRPFMVTALGATIAIFVLYGMNASGVMRVFAVSTLVQVMLMVSITVLWQISIHSISVSGLFVTAAVLFGPIAGLVVLPMVLLVALARLRLHRHTRAQVIAGMIVGSVSVAALFAMAGSVTPGL